MSGSYYAGDLVLDIESRSVARDGELLPLSDLSFAALLELVANAPEAVSNQQLAANVWNSDYVSAETIAQRIRIVRRALDDQPQSPTYVRTVRSHGYAFIAPVSAANSDVKTAKKAAFLGIAAALMIGLLAAWFLVAPGTNNDETVLNQQPPSEIEQMIGRARELLNVQQAAATDQGIAILSQALDVDQDNSNTMVSLSFALSTRATKFRPGKDDAMRAEALAREALAMNSNNGSAWHALAYALDARGRVDDALNAYQMAYELNPEDIAAMSSAAYLFQIRGRIYESLVLEASAMSIARNQYSRYADTQIARSLELLGHSAAHTWRTRAQRIAPNQVVVLAETATAFLRAGNPDAVVSLLSRYDTDSTTAPRLTRLLGRAELARGNLQHARHLFEIAGERASSDLAAVNALNGEYESASARLRELELSMLEGDSWPETRIQTAELSAVLGNHDDAIEFISQAIDLGWRDLELLRQSPFLAPSQKTEGWLFLEKRIESQILIQNRLVTQSDSLQSVLSI